MSRRPGASKAVRKEVRLGKGRLRGAVGEGGDACHEVGPDVGGTGHGTRADIMGTEVIVRVLTVQARESRSREEAGQAGRLVVLGETRGPRNLFIAYKKDSVSLDMPFIQTQPQGLTPNTRP